jgi:hypothetical protein
MRLSIRKIAAGFVLVAASFTTAFTAGTIAASPASASVNWTARTCAAEQAYVDRPTTANLDAMMTDSLHAPWRYVGNDAAGLYSDVRSGSVKYVASDERYFSEDCS